MLIAGALPAAAQTFSTSAHLFGSGTTFSFPDVSNSSSVRAVSATVNHSGTFNLSSDPANASSASIQGDAAAGFGDLHLFLTATTVGNFASGGSGASASSKGGVTFSDRVRFDNTGLPLGSDISVRLELNVFDSVHLSAGAPDPFGGGYAGISATLSLQDSNGEVGSVSFLETNLQSATYQSKVAPATFVDNRFVTLTLKTGVNYTLSGVMDGEASVSSFVSEASPATVVSAATVDAGHTALFAILPQTPGTSFAASSGGTYQAVPEPQEWTLMAGVALIGWAGVRRWRKSRCGEVEGVKR